MDLHKIKSLIHLNNVTKITNNVMFYQNLL